MRVFFHHLPSFPPDADGHPPALDQGRHQGKARRPEAQGQGIAEEEVRVLYHVHKARRGAAYRREVQDEVEVQGQLFLPAGDDLLPAGLPARGAGEIDVDHQRPQDAQRRQVRGRAAARRHPLIVALGPVEAVRGPGLGVVVEPEGPAPVPEVLDVAVPRLMVVIGGRPGVPVGGIEGQTQVGGIGRLIVPEEFYGVRSQPPPQVPDLGIGRRPADRALRKGGLRLAVPAVDVGDGGHGAVPHGGGQQQHPQEEDRRLHPEALPRFPFHFSPSSILYPRPQTTFR